MYSAYRYRLLDPERVVRADTQNGRYVYRRRVDHIGIDHNAVTENSTQKVGAVNSLAAVCEYLRSDMVRRLALAGIVRILLRVFRLVQRGAGAKDPTARRRGG
jgi:hypothetical protein